MSNTILFMSDEHNPFYSSVYGHPAIETPNMERLAASGVVYENAYCPSPLCMPSRSAFMTGRRVHDVQVYNNCNVGLNRDYPSYGSVLSRQGVHTVYAGKVHVYDGVRNLGFSETILAPEEGMTGGDLTFWRNPVPVREKAAARADGYGPKEGAFARDVECVEASLEWLRKTAPTLEGPWLLVVNVVKPHFPHFVTQELWDRYPQGEDLPAHGVECETAQHPFAQSLRRHFETEQFTEEQVRGLRRGYLGCITHVDRQLGQVLDALEAIAERERTNVIYTTDHGEMLGKFGMWWKCVLFEDAARVPLVAAGPDFPTGAVRTPVDLLDLQAAIFRALGAQRPGGWVGTPLQDIPADDPKRPVFSEYHGHGTPASAYMIRKGPWKYVHTVGAPHLLFNLDEDSEELASRYAARPDIAEDMERELRKVCDPAAENARAEEFLARQMEAVKREKPSLRG